MLAPHIAGALLQPHILDELTLATPTLSCHSSEVRAAENWVAEGILLSLQIPGLLGCLGGKLECFLWGRGCLETGWTPYVGSFQRGTPSSTPRPHPVCGGWWPSWLCSSGPDRLSTSPNCSATDRHSCTDVEESRIVLAILHQTVSYSDCIVLVVVSTNVMRELLI